MAAFAWPAECGAAARLRGTDSAGRRVRSRDPSSARLPAATGWGDARSCRAGGRPAARLLADGRCACSGASVWWGGSSLARNGAVPGPTGRGRGPRKRARAAAAANSAASAGVGCISLRPPRASRVPSCVRTPVCIHATVTNQPCLLVDRCLVECRARGSVHMGALPFRRGIRRVFSSSVNPIISTKCGARSYSAATELTPIVCSMRSM